MVVADMPFLSYQSSPRDAVINAGRFMKEGLADGVKVEGGAAVAPILAAIHRAGIPVIAHIGLTPQSAKTSEGAMQLLQDAVLLEEAGGLRGLDGMRPGGGGAPGWRAAHYANNQLWRWAVL
jgi:3-methyl-2-oxobutanoate hydroxymethyltransferase